MVEIPIYMGMHPAQKRYQLVSELREFLETNGGPNWRTDPSDLPINFEAVTENTLLVDVRKVDKAWSKPKHVAFRISAQGNNEIENRTRQIVDWLKVGGPIDPSDAYYSKETGGVDFADGRHRFSLLRDAGVLVLPMNSDSPGDLMVLEAKSEEIEGYLAHEHEEKEEKEQKEQNRVRGALQKPTKRDDLGLSLL